MFLLGRCCSVLSRLLAIKQASVPLLVSPQHLLRGPHQMGPLPTLINPHVTTRLSLPTRHLTMSHHPMMSHHCPMICLPQHLHLVSCHCMTLFPPFWLSSCLHLRVVREQVSHCESTGLLPHGLFPMLHLAYLVFSLASYPTSHADPLELIIAKLNGLESQVRDLQAAAPLPKDPPTKVKGSSRRRA